MAFLKMPLRWIIKFVVVHPLSSLAMVVLLGVVFFFASDRVPNPLAVQAGSGVASDRLAGAPSLARGNLPAADSTESFMKGQATFDADLVWGSLSSDLHSSLTAQGGGKDTIQEQLDEYRQEGRQIDDFVYVGGYSPGGGKTFYFYVASVRRPELGGQPDQVFFAFTVDPQGKIARVE